MNAEYDTGERFMVGVEIMTAMDVEPDYALVNHDMQRLMLPIIDETIHLNTNELLQAAQAVDAWQNPFLAVAEKRGRDEDRRKLLDMYQYNMDYPPRPFDPEESDAQVYALLVLRIDYATRKFQVGYGTVYSDSLAEFETMYTDPAFQAAERLINYLICQLNHPRKITTAS